MPPLILLSQDTMNQGRAASYMIVHSQSTGLIEAVYFSTDTHCQCENTHSIGFYAR